MSELKKKETGPERYKRERAECIEVLGRTWNHLNLTHQEEVVYAMRQYRDLATAQQAERLKELEGALEHARTGYSNLIEYDILNTPHKATAELIIFTIDNALTKSK